MQTLSQNNFPSYFSLKYGVDSRGGGKSHMFKSQASLKSQYKQIKQVKSAAHLKQVKSSPDIRVKSSHSIKQEQIYFCHTTLLIFPQKLTFLIIHFK